MKFLHRTANRIASWAAVLALALLVGCGGSSGPGDSSHGGYSSIGRMTVHLVDAPTADFQAINIHIRSVEIGSEAGWITLGTPDAGYDLLQLTGGISQTLADGATLPAGTFGQLRLILGPDNTVTLADGSVKQLKVPSGTQTGIKMNVNATVADGATIDVWIDFDAARSVQAHSAGASGKYMLRPVVRAVTKTETGTITGVFTDNATGAPIAGAAVYAETVDSAGNPSIVRGTFTDGAGAYTLDLLPLDFTYYVVSQPGIGDAGAAIYTARASPGIALSFGAQAVGYDTTFTPAPGTGTVMGTLTATATDGQSDVVNLMQTIGPASQALIVATAVAEVGATETYTVTPVAAGSYTSQAIRSTDNGDGTFTQTVSAAVGPATVTGGGTATLDIPGLP